jgi:hypothetical protein
MVVAWYQPIVPVGRVHSFAPLTQLIVNSHLILHMQRLMLKVPLQHVLPPQSSVQFNCWVDIRNTASLDLLSMPPSVCAIHPMSCNLGGCVSDVHRAIVSMWVSIPLAVRGCTREARVSCDAALTSSWHGFLRSRWPLDWPGHGGAVMWMLAWVHGGWGVMERCLSMFPLPIPICFGGVESGDGRWNPGCRSSVKLDGFASGLCCVE